MNPLSIDHDLLPLTPANASRNSSPSSSSDAFLRHLNSNRSEPSPADHSPSPADSVSDGSRNRAGIDDRNSERQARTASPPAVTRRPDSHDEPAAEEELESSDQPSDWFESVDAPETQPQSVSTDAGVLVDGNDGDGSALSDEVARGGSDNHRLDSHRFANRPESKPRSKATSPPSAAGTPVPLAARKLSGTGSVKTHSEVRGDSSLPLSSPATAQVETPSGELEAVATTADETPKSAEVPHLESHVVQIQAIPEVPAVPSDVVDNTGSETPGQESGSAKTANARATVRKSSAERLENSDRKVELDQNSIANSETTEIIEAKLRDKSYRVNRGASDRPRHSLVSSPPDSQTPRELNSTPSSSALVAERTVTSGEPNPPGVPTVLVGDHRPDLPPRTRVAMEAASVEHAVAGTSTGTRDQARFVQRVTRAIQASRERDGEVRLRLSPPELGALRLEVRLQGNQMSAFIEAETAAARNLLRENLPLLRERLAEQGIQIQNFDVELLDRRPPDTGNGFAQSSQYQSNEGNSDNRPRREQPQENRQPVLDDITPTSVGKLPADGRINVII